MTTITLIIQEPPYADNKKAYDGLRLAGACLAEDMRVRIFLLSGGIEVGRRHQEPPPGRPHLGELLGQLLEYGAEVLACGVCMDECGMVQADLLDGIERGSMKSLATWIGESQWALTF